MTFHASGFRSIGVMGIPSATSEAGNVRQVHTFITNDDRATIETTGYFNSLLNPKIVKIGDLFDVVFDVDGIVGTRRYVVTSVTTNVVITPNTGDDSGGLSRAVIPTAAGLTTGLILPTDSMVTATSANANHILQLPACSAATMKREIWIWVVPSTNCELQTAAGSGNTINNVDCSGGAVELLMTHTQLYICRQHLATGWLVQAMTALGAVATAIVPD